MIGGFCEAAKGGRLHQRTNGQGSASTRGRTLSFVVFGPLTATRYRRHRRDSKPMPLTTQHAHLREAAVLSRAIENVLRKMVRLLMGRISLIRLQEMLRLVFVEEAESFLKNESPGKNVPMTKLALMTGLDTRTLGRLREEAEKGGAVHESNRFLREITPECSILDYWQVNPKYLNPATGEPQVLPLKGRAPSFESLISETLSSRGVTVSSLLQRLERTKAVEIDRDAATVKMLDSRFWPFLHEGDTAMLEIGLISAGNLVDTISHNIVNKGDKERSFFHRSTWTHRLPVSKRVELRASIRKLLSLSESQVTEVLSSFEENEIDRDQVTVGACLFYFEEEAASELPEFEDSN